ncbi:hypothetical protein F4859DRAFT_473602 [Xylaria cf. heliscus]|nr:hypothetical protein F4859DRAFT_473602 [Xylaria cf. heliscus]
MITIPLRHWMMLVVCTPGAAFKVSAERVITTGHSPQYLISRSSQPRPTRLSSLPGWSTSYSPYGQIGQFTLRPGNRCYSKPFYRSMILNFALISSTECRHVPSIGTVKSFASGILAVSLPRSAKGSYNNMTTKLIFTSRTPPVLHSTNAVDIPVSFIEYVHIISSIVFNCKSRLHAHKRRYYEVLQGIIP